jgi:alcohol dehydrogenase (NADP+)
MLCAGLTVWAPLKTAGVGPGKKVAIVGLGGLGHFAVLWAAALGAEVTVISHSPDKKEDALKLGAKDFVTTEKDDWAKPLAFKFDFALNTADMTHEFNISNYLSILNVGCQFHQVGLPDQPIEKLSPGQFTANGSSIGASHIGSRKQCLEMLQFAAERKLFPIVETIPISEEGCAKVMEGVKNNKVRYRYTLTDFDKAFGA